MKASEIRELSLDERTQKLSDLTEELFNLRFQHQTGQLENSAKLTRIKGDIARIKTIIRENKSDKLEL
ncbi:MAG: 50S ribosomal protein L29 [Desulfobacterales bacterium]|nr:50S ribosomal protein L29 [Desulfobacterales bacterium]MDZ4210067.1 50S ribosomal protein L29 [Candidatus Curtissbacteria bacterium]